LELVPQGNLAERIRQPRAMRPGRSKESTISSGSLSEPISLSFKAHVGDEVGNLSYRKTARNFGPIMASAARTSIVQVSHIVAVGQIDPDNVVTPCIHTRRMVAVPAAGAPEPEARHERAGPAWSRRARRAGCKGHPGGVIRQPWDRPADSRVELPRTPQRGHASHREWHARDGAGGSRR
jgi:hypothetical protein